MVLVLVAHGEQRSPAAHWIAAAELSMPSPQEMGGIYQSNLPDCDELGKRRNRLFPFIELYLDVRVLHCLLRGNACAQVGVAVLLRDFPVPLVRLVRIAAGDVEYGGQEAARDGIKVAMCICKIVISHISTRPGAAVKTHPPPAHST